MSGIRRRYPSLVLFGLKSANMALATAWTFLLAFSLIGIVGLEGYALLASMLAAAALILQADLGISIRLFGRIRTAFLGEAPLEREALGSTVAAAFWSYLVVVLVALLGFAALVWGMGLGKPEERPVFLLIFFGAILPLPWQVLRAALNACDRFLLTETVDCVRRSVLLALTVALSFGMPLIAYAILFPLLWIVALAVMVVAARPVLGSLGLTKIRAGFAELFGDRTALGASAVLAVAELLIYVHPYYLIPLLGGSAVAVVAFDMLYKVARFGLMTYLVIAETFQPRQTRHWHARDIPAMRRDFGRSMMLGAVPALLAIVLLLGWGDALFTAMLGRAGVVDQGERYLMAAMLALGLMKTLSGNLLAALGIFRPLAFCATLTLLAMVGAAVLGAAMGLDATQRLEIFVSIYAAQSTAYLLVLAWLLRMRDPALRGASSPGLFSPGVAGPTGTNGR